MGPDLRYDGGVAGPECQFGRRNYRRHVYFSDHGADYGYRLFARDQRFRPAEKIRQELRPDVRRGDFDFDPLLFHLPAGECEQ